MVYLGEKRKNKTVESDSPTPNFSLVWKDMYIWSLCFVCPLKYCSTVTPGNPLHSFLSAFGNAASFHSKSKQHPSLFYHLKTIQSLLPLIASTFTTYCHSFHVISLVLSINYFNTCFNLSGLATCQTESFPQF